MSSMAQRRITSTESPGMDWLDGLISIVGVVSTVSDVSPVPWVSAATEVVLNILKRIKSSVQNAEDLKDLANSIVEFVSLLRDSTIQYAESSLDSGRENPFKQTCIDFTNTLTTISNELNTMKNRDKNWLKKYLKAGSIGRKIDKYKEALGHIQNQLTARAALQTGLYLPRIGDDISRHRTEFREHFQELKSHIVGTGYRGQFTILKRGDVRLIRQQAVHLKYVVDIRTTGVVSTQKLTKRQRRHQRFYGETCAKYSVDHIDWVANVCREGDERVVRQYKGPYPKARFEEDLELYQNAMHPNIAQVFGVLPEFHSIVFYDDATFTLWEYLANIPSCIDRFIAEYRIAEEILSLEEYCNTNPYSVALYWKCIPISRYTERVSLTFGRNGVIRVAEAFSHRNFWVPGFTGRLNHPIPSIEIFNLFKKKRSTHVLSSSLLSMLYSAMETRQDISIGHNFQSIQLAAKPYKTSILGLAGAHRIIPDGFEKIAQLPLCHGPDTYSRQRVRFRWRVYGARRMPQIRGWTVCEVSSPETLYLSAHPIRKLKPRADIFLSQIHRLFLLSGSHEADLQYVEEIWFHLRFIPERPRVDTTEWIGLAGTFMSENDDPMYRRKQEKAYIFIRDAEVNMYDDTSVLTTPEMYWASDPEGVVRWTDEELTEYLAAWDLQTDDLRLQVEYKSYFGKKENLDTLREAHRLYGFDPDSDEIAKALGYPVLEVKPTFIPRDILAPRPDSEENEEVDRTKLGSDVETRPGTENLQSSIVEVDDAEITQALMDQLSPEKSASCVSDNDSGVTKPEDQCLAVENTRESIKSKSGADSPASIITEESCEHNAATSNEASTAQDPSELCSPRNDNANVIVDDHITHSEMYSSTSASPTREECPPPGASIEEVSASKTYGATEQICQSEIQASACRKLLKTLCLVFPPTFIIGILIGILFTLAYHSPYLVIPKISVHVEF